MKKGFKKVTALLLLCSLLTSMFAFTGCTYGGASTAYNVKESLIQALNSEDYEKYISLAYPAVREAIEEEREELDMSESEYMQHLKDTIFPFKEDTLITQSSKIPSVDKNYDETMLQLLSDQYIYMDEYIELDSASSSKFLIRDYKYKDEDAISFHMMEIVIVCAGGHYYFSSYTIDKNMYDFNAATETPTTTVAE
jgi:hypothetical protein